MKKYAKYLSVFNLIMISIFASRSYSTNLDNFIQGLSPITAPLLPSGGKLIFDPDDILDIIKAANQGDVNKQNQLIKHYQDIDPLVLKKIDLAKWSDLVPRLKESPAFFDLAQIINFNFNFKLNYNDLREIFKTYEIYENSKDSDDFQRRTNLATLYFLGVGTKQDFFKSLEILNKLDEEKFVSAQYNLALLNLAAKNRVKSLSLFEEAIAQKYTYAENYLAKVLSFDTENSDNLAKSFNLHCSAADKGFGSSALEAAIMYDKGIGTVEDPVKATIYFTKAAKQGFTEAQYKLGLKYYHGSFIAVDFNLAAKYFEQAADQSYPLAQYYLALCYCEGLGVQENALEAVRLFHHAAVNGHKESQEKIFNFLQPIVLKPYNSKSQQAFDKLDRLILIVQKNNRETFELLRNKNDPNSEYSKQNPEILRSLETFQDLLIISRVCQELPNLKDYLMNPGFMVNCFKNAVLFMDTKDDEFLKSYDLNDEKPIFLNYGIQNVKNSKLINELMENIILLRTYYRNYQVNVDHYRIKTLKLRDEINLRIENKQEFKKNNNPQACKKEEADISHQRNKYDRMITLSKENSKLHSVFKKTYTDFKKIMNWLFEDTQRRNHLLMDTYPFLKT